MSTEKEDKLQSRIDEVISELDKLHQDPRYCKGEKLCECRTDECWIWRLLMLLKAPL